MKLAFLGLGVMGYPMAGHLQQAGHEVAVYNRTASKAEKWAAEYKGQKGEIAEIVKDAEMVFACVGNDKDAEDVAQTAFAHMQHGALYVDHTTISASTSVALAKAAQAKNLSYMDAPVSGGEAGAVNGQLSIMCGADDADMVKAEPVMQAFAKRIVHIGGIGQGQQCKAVNQIAIAGVLQGLAEAVNFAEKSGLDVGKTLDAISGGAAQSWQMENRMATMAANKFDFGFAVDWMRKDLDIALAEGKKVNADMTMTETIRQYYEEISQNGGGRFDTSSLITRINGKA